MKKFVTICLFALMMCFVGSVSAQYTFVVDALHGSTTAVYPYDAKWSEDWVHLGEKTGELPNGTEVTIAQNDTIPRLAYFQSIKKGKEYKDDVIAITYAGTKYLVASKDLILSPNDTSGTDDFINKDGKLHTSLGRWYSTSTPFYLILVLLVLATVFAAFTGDSVGPRLLPAILVPVCLLLAILIEIMGVITMGKGLLWWADADQYKLGTVIFRLVLFGVAVVLQIFSMRLYKNGLSASARGELSVKAPIVGALVGAGLLLFCVILSTMIRKSVKPETMFYIGIGLLLLSTLIGIITTAVKNIRAVGGLGGIAFTLFAVIYGVGLVVALVMLIIGFVNAFMEVLVTVVGGTFVLMIMSKFIPARSYTSGGVRYEVYEDFNPFKK